MQLEAQYSFCCPQVCEKDFWLQANSGPPKGQNINVTLRFTLVSPLSSRRFQPEKHTFHLRERESKPTFVSYAEEERFAQIEVSEPIRGSCMYVRWTGGVLTGQAETEDSPTLETSGTGLEQTNYLFLLWNYTKTVSPVAA